MATLKRRVVKAKNNGQSKKSFFVNASWAPVPNSEVSLKEALDEEEPGLFEDIDGDLGEIQVTEFPDGSERSNIVIPLSDGATIELPLSGKSSLIEGDLVDLSTVQRITLRKRGEDPIKRYDGKKYEGEVEEA